MRQIPGIFSCFQIPFSSVWGSGVSLVFHYLFLFSAGEGIPQSTIRVGRPGFLFCGPIFSGNQGNPGNSRGVLRRLYRERGTRLVTTFLV